MYQVRKYIMARASRDPRSARDKRPSAFHSRFEYTTQIAGKKPRYRIGAFRVVDPFQKPQSNHMKLPPPKRTQ